MGCILRGGEKIQVRQNVWGEFDERGAGFPRRDSEIRVSVKTAARKEKKREKLRVPPLTILLLIEHGSL